MSSSKKIKIAPSILAANFSRLGEQILEAEEAGADWIHVDVMDGHFVPNLTFGPPVIKSVRAVTKLPFDVHLMIDSPEQSIPDYVAAGADRVTVHVETCPHLHRTLQQIRELGAKTGVTLNPGTPLCAIDGVLDVVDLVLVMSVNPGFGGQKYIPSSTGKISCLRKRLEDLNPEAELQVDGGVNIETIKEVADAGSTVLVIGSAIFNDHSSVAENITTLRKLIEEK